MRPASAAARGGFKHDSKSSTTTNAAATSLAAPVTSANASEHRRNLEEHLRRLENERRQHQDTTNDQLKQNKELIKELRRENQELKSMIAAAKRGQGSVQQVEGMRLEQQIAQATRRFDSLRAEERDHREALRLEHEKLAVIELDSQPLLLPNSALSRRIRALESRLDKSLIKYNEAVSIKRTYELIARRLKDERVGFDNQLAAIERTLKSKEYDYQELLKMSHAANHAKEKAKRDLQQFKLKFDADRRAKDRELAERKAFVQSRVEQTQRLERKERNLKQQEADEERMRQEENQRAQNANAMQQGNQNSNGSPGSFGDGDLGTDEASQRTKLVQYENAFRRIQAATGVRDLQEMLQRFVTSEETHRQLEQLASDSQARIDQMRVENNELSRRVEELRYSGSGAVGSRRLTQEFTLHLAEAANQTKAAQQQFERLAKLLVHVKAGVEHLMDKLVVYRPDLVTPPMSDETVMEVLKVAEQKLYALVDEMGPVGTAAATASGAGGQLASQAPPPELPPYNRRIRPPRDDEEADDADGAGGARGDDDDPGQDDEAVLRREQVKKISANAILRESKKQRRKKAQMQG